MSQKSYKFSFDRKVPLKEVEESLLLAVLAVESLHGRSLIRLNVSFFLDKAKCSCVIDASTEVGNHIACIFTGFLTREFGEHTFRVKRLFREKDE